MAHQLSIKMVILQQIELLKKFDEKWESSSFGIRLSLAHLG